MTSVNCFLVGKFEADHVLNFIAQAFGSDACAKGLVERPDSGFPTQVHAVNPREGLATFRGRSFHELSQQDDGTRPDVRQAIFPPVSPQGDATASCTEQI